MASALPVGSELEIRRSPTLASNRVSTNCEQGEIVMQNLKKKSLWGRTAFAAAALAGALLFMNAPPLRADESGCQRRLAKADHQLHEAAKHHGWESKQAEHARHELREAREWCWTHEHKWWDEDNRRWHTDRDWDDHDHDRDH